MRTVSKMNLRAVMGQVPCGSGWDDAFGGGVPLQVLALAVRQNAELASHDAVIAQGGVALERHIGTDGGDQVLEVQGGVFAAGLAVHDFALRIAVEFLRTNDE